MSEQTQYVPKVAFWKKESGNLMTSSKGLNEREVEMLKNLKVGDRLLLKLFKERRSDNDPDGRLEVYVKPAGGYTQTPPNNTTTNELTTNDSNSGGFRRVDTK